MRSKRWAVRGARAQGDSASREMHGGLPRACVKGAGRPRTRGLKHPRSALVRVHPRRVVVVNVREQGGRRTEHDEAVKMVNFSRTKKPAKCDLPTNPRESLLEGARPRE